MKNLWVFFILGGIVLASGLGTLVAYSANSDIVINEIGGYTTSTHEWIEVWNKGSDTVDLTGWKFWEGNTKHGITPKLGDTLLTPGEFGAIVQDDVQFLKDHPEFNGSVFDSSWGSLNESGEEVGLIDATGVEIEKFVYHPFSAYSLERVNPFLNEYTNVNWKEHGSGHTVGIVNSVYAVEPSSGTTSTESNIDPAATSTEGVANETASSTVDIVSSSSTPDVARFTFIHINEVVPRPESGEPEWVELFNASTTPIDLTGGVLCDGREGSCVVAKLEGIIPAGGFITIYLSSSYLNNDGDSVILKNDYGEEMERVVYNNELVPEVGESIIRTDTNSYVLTTVPTPEATNILLAPVEPAVVTVNVGGGSSTTNYDQTSSVVTANKSASTTHKVKKVTEIPKTTVAWNVEAPIYALLNERVRFSSVGSADPRGGELFFRWQFEDGEALEGEWVEHAFTTTGTMHVTVFATSSAGTTGSHVVTIPVLAPQINSVVLNEIYANAKSGENEFVEIANTGLQEKDISGWRIVVEDDVFTLPPSTTIPALGYRVLYRKATNLVLPNNSTTITLLTNKNEVADIVLLPKISTGKTYVRSLLEWKISEETTPGFANIFVSVLGEKIEEKTKVPTKVKTVSKNSVTITALADLRDMPTNENVVITGAVTVLPGIFGTQTLYITDNTGSAEIYSSKKTFPTVTPGSVVRVQGSLGKGVSLPRVKIKNVNDVRVVGSTSTTAHTLALNLIDEEIIGAIIEVTGEITQAKKGQFYIDDGTGEIAVTLKPGAAITVAPRVGMRANVVGMVMRGKSGVELWPRGIEDITLSAGTDTQTEPVNKKTATPYVALSVVGTGAIVAAWKWRELFVKLLSLSLKKN